jgi:hypothetical protein
MNNMIIIDKFNNITNFNNVSDITIGQDKDKFYISCRLCNGETYGLGIYTNQDEADKGCKKIVNGYRFRKRIVRL